MKPIALGLVAALQLPLLAEDEAKPLHIWLDEEPDQTWTVTGQYPEVPSATHTVIFKGNEANGGYNHHAKIYFWGGRFHASWSNCRYDEDGVGQRVLYASSEDGENWSMPREVVPSLSPEAPWGFPGYFCQACEFQEFEGRLFATASVTEIVEWTNRDKTLKSPVYDKKRTGFPVYKHYGKMAREIRADGTFGELFTMFREPLDDKKLIRPIRTQAQVEPAFAMRKEGWNLADAIKKSDGRRLCEPTVWKAPNGSWVCLFRDDSGSHRKWMCASRDGKEWSKPVMTDMHDAPSQTCSLALKDGTVLLVGNHRGAGKVMPGIGWRDRDPLMISLSRDGVRFSHTMAVREGPHEYTVKGPHAPRARGGSAQYPRMLVHGDKCYVIYSEGKEDIEVTSFDLKAYLEF